MKNDFTNISEKEIHSWPIRFKGYFLSRFSTANGYVSVPTSTFREMLSLVAELARIQASPSTEVSAIEGAVRSPAVMSEQGVPASEALRLAWRLTGYRRLLAEAQEFVERVAGRISLREGDNTAAADLADRIEAQIADKPSLSYDSDRAEASAELWRVLAAFEGEDADAQILIEKAMASREQAAVAQLTQADR